MKKLILIFFILNTLFLFSQEKRKIAVYGFEGKEIEVNNKIKNIIEKELINQNRFDVLSKKAVFKEVWQEEANLGIDKIGTDFKGIDLLFTGEVLKKDSNYIFNYKIIDVEDSKILMSDSVDFKYKNIDILGVYFQRKLLEQFPVSGNIIEKDGKIIYINLGKKDGLKEGSLLEIFKLKNKITDPETNEVFNVGKEKLGEARVKTVEKKYSSANLEDNLLFRWKVKKGDEVQVKNFTKINNRNKDSSTKKNNLNEKFRDIKGRYTVKVGKIEKADIIPSGVFSTNLTYVDSAILDFRIGILDYFEFGIGGVFDGKETEDNNFNFNLKSSIDNRFLTTGLKYELGTDNSSNFLTLLLEKNINKIDIDINAMYKYNLSGEESKNNTFGMALEYNPKFTDRLVPAIEYINDKNNEDILIKFDFELKRSLWFGLGKVLGEDGNYYFKLEKNGIFVR